MVGRRCSHVVSCPQSSGIDCTDEAVEAFNELKLKHTYKYIVYAMDAAHTKIEILKKASRPSQCPFIFPSLFFLVSRSLSVVH